MIVSEIYIVAVRPDEQWSSVKIFLQISGLIENKILLSGFLPVLFFSNFTFDFNGFHLKKLIIIQNDFDLARGRKKFVLNNEIKTIECLCFGPIGLILAPWKFDVLKTSMFVL